MSQELSVFDVKLAPGETKIVPAAWKVGADACFGHELSAELRGGDGNIVDAKGEFFTVGWNNYRVGQCRLVQPWTYDMSSKTLPNITPLDRWLKWLPDIRDTGAVLTEYFFWAPDDFGNLTPEEDQWFSGQSKYLISQQDIHAVIDAAHAQGLAAVTYGKNWMSVSGMQVGRDGVELVRQHPEWCQWMVGGSPKWWFNQDQYRWTFDQWRESIQTTGRGKGSIGGVAVNCAELPCVQYGCEEIVRSARKYGWDGVRFDDHFTMEPVFDGGLCFDGQMMERGGDFEELSARNNRLTLEIARAANPRFLLGFNYAGIYADRGIRYPEAYAETCRDGQFVMLEWSQWWPNTLKTWGNVVEVLTGENHRVQGMGGVPGMCHMNPNCKWRDQALRWESAINYASQGHYYNVSNLPPVVKNTKFMLRHGGLLYDQNCQAAMNPDAWLKIEASAPVLWRPFVHERTIDQGHRQIVASVINLPPDADILKTPLPLPPIDKVALALTIPDGWRLERCRLLDPDANTNPQAQEFSAATGKATVELKRLECWNLLVFDLAKN